MTSWHCAPLTTITAQDKRRAGPIIRKWLGALYATQDLAYWERAFAKIEDVSAKTRPSRPVQVFRGARSASEIGNPTHYARWTSWSFDPHHGFRFTPPGEAKAPNVTAFVHPEDIEIVLPAFGPGMYREGLCEVILKPGFYIVEKQPYMPSRPPPLSPKNHGQDGAYVSENTVAVRETFLRAALDFERGDCAVLALRLAELTGYPLVGMFERDDLHHVAVEVDRDHVLDIAGVSAKRERAEAAGHPKARWRKVDLRTIKAHGLPSFEGYDEDELDEVDAAAEGLAQ